MGFLDSLIVKLNFIDLAYRMKTVRNLSDQKKLSAIAKKNADSRLRNLAAARITDERILMDIAKNDDNHYVRKAAAARITDQNVLMDIAKNDDSYIVRKAAAARITDQNVLVDIAKNDDNHNVRITAAARVNDQNVLMDIAKNDDSYIVRKAAAARITDQNVLVDIAKNDDNHNVRITAAARVNDQNVLMDIAKNDDSYIVRKAAAERVTDHSISVSITKHSSWKDDDDIVYKTLIIEETEWLAENWKRDIPGSGCYDNFEHNISQFGRLYPQKEARKYCPAGWRLPDDKDWENLVKLLGGFDVAGGKLKEVGYGGTDEIGFGARLGGFYCVRKFIMKSYQAGFWSSNDNTVWHAGGDSIERQVYINVMYCSVRLIRNI